MEINKNLISLKCVLFLFFGALGSLLPFLPLHMKSLGIITDESADEGTIISIVAPLVALIGPLVAAPLADRLAGGFGGAQRSKTGRYLRVMIAVCCALATISYWLLITIAPIHRSPPHVTFTCNQHGGFILQEKCGPERTCYNWNGEHGSVLVKHCIFTCNATAHYKRVFHTTPTPNLEDAYNSTESTTDENYDDTNDLGAPDEGENTADVQPQVEINYGIEPSPHMCFNNSQGVTICEVYTEFSSIIDFNLGLQPSVKNDVENPESDEVEEDVCRYPFADSFHCRITQETERELQSTNSECHPVILCEIHDPYNNSGSLLKKSQCGYNNISFWLYLFMRSVADIFPAAAVALLNTAVVIATRETSTGRSDVGKQFAAGALGFGIFAPLVGKFGDGIFFNAMICFTALMIIAIVILLFDNNMPLGPPEWWWHTRCGLLALPMSSVRKYGLEIVALGVVLFTLGVFWNAIDTYLPWHLVNLSSGSPLVIGYSITFGALPAAILYVFAERIVDYCSHFNILILCFVTYIVHHVALLAVKDAVLLLLFEALEVFTLHLMWITAVLYLRHLVPRKFTACGQALPVVAHACLGRVFGAWLGSYAYTDNKKYFDRVHEVFAIAAAVIAAIFFLAYHYYLKTKCLPPPQLPPYPAPSLVQSMNGNGSYTPLRVYHNGKSKKGHFRY